MLIIVTDRTGVLDESVKQSADRRLRFALSRFDGRITKVDVVFGDPLDGPGESDQSVCLSIKVRGAADVCIVDRDVQPERCIARLAERAARDVRRAIDRAKLFIPTSDRSEVHRGAS